MVITFNPGDIVIRTDKCSDEFNGKKFKVICEYIIDNEHLVKTIAVEDIKGYPKGYEFNWYKWRLKLINSKKEYLPTWL